MKIITKNTDYAIQALIYISSKKGESVSAKDLSEKLEVSWPFLRKILQILSKNGYVKSKKGRGGGFVLVKEPEEIALYDIIEIFQGEFSTVECIIRDKVCKNINRCMLRIELKEIENIIAEKLKTITLKNLLWGNSNKKDIKPVLINN